MSEYHQINPDDPREAARNSAEWDAAEAVEELPEVADDLDLDPDGEVEDVADLSDEELEEADAEGDEVADEAIRHAASEVLDGFRSEVAEDNDDSPPPPADGC